MTNCGTTAINLWVTALLGPDDLIVAPHECYGGTYRLLNNRAKKGDFKVQFVDQSNVAALTQALARKPKLLLIETLQPFSACGGYCSSLSVSESTRHFDGGR